MKEVDNLDTRHDYDPSNEQHNTDSTSATLRAQQVDSPELAAGKRVVDRL